MSYQKPSLIVDHHCPYYILNNLSLMFFLRDEASGTIHSTGRVTVLTFLFFVEKEDHDSCPDLSSRTKYEEVWVNIVKEEHEIRTDTFVRFDRRTIKRNREGGRIVGVRNRTIERVRSPESHLQWRNLSGGHRGLNFNKRNWVYEHRVRGYT